MNQTGFNLVAISIFVLTFSSLLGPWLHISPTIPAVATVVCLGLVTVDALNWQGKGITLLLDWLTRVSGGAEYQARIVRHEAGHFLVAYLLGLPITGYTLNAWEAFKQGQPGQGGVAFDVPGLAETIGSRSLSLATQQETIALLDRYSTVCMAGIAAETVVYGAAEGGTDDRQQLRAFWAQLRQPNVDPQQKERWAILKAQTLIQEHLSAYEALVTAMAEHAPVADCYRAIEQFSKNNSALNTDGAGTGALPLA